MTIKRKALIAEVRLNKNNARNCLRNIRCKSPSLHEGDWVPSSQRQEAVTLLVSASELLHEVLEDHLLKERDELLSLAGVNRKTANAVIEKLHGVKLPPKK